MAFNRILVTGGAGFIGSNFIRLLLRERPTVEVVNLDALTYCGNLENLADLVDEPRHRFVRGDITQIDDVTSAMADCDAVVHFAAESHVDRSILDSGPFIRTNVGGTSTCSTRHRATVRVDQGRFVHVSTDEVYGQSAARSAGSEVHRRLTDSPQQPVCCQQSGERSDRAFVSQDLRTGRVHHTLLE